MKISRRCILAFFLISMTIPKTVDAQSADSTNSHSRSWAFQLGIGSNFTLTSFQGSTVGLLYRISEANAVRGGITLSGSTSDGTSLYAGAVHDTSASNMPGNSSSKSVNISFVIQYLWYGRPGGPLVFYGGTGPYLSYSYSRSSQLYNNLYSYYDTGSTIGYWSTTSYNSSSTQWGAGVAIAAGVEWPALSWLSLHADYTEGIQYHWGSNSSGQSSSATYPNAINTRSSNAGSTTGWTFSGQGVAFGLNAYF